MTTIKRRKELLDALVYQTSKLKEASDDAEPNSKNLKTRIKELQDSMTEYEAYYYKQSSDEEDTAAKNELKREFMIEMRKADLVLYPAEDLFDTLVGSDEDFTDKYDDEVDDLPQETEEYIDNISKEESVEENYTNEKQDAKCVEDDDMSAAPVSFKENVSLLESSPDLKGLVVSTPTLAFSLCLDDNSLKCSPEPSRLVRFTPPSSSLIFEKCPSISSVSLGEKESDYSLSFFLSCPENFESDIRDPTASSLISSSELLSTVSTDISTSWISLNMLKSRDIRMWRSCSSTMKTLSASTTTFTVEGFSSSSSLPSSTRSYSSSILFRVDEYHLNSCVLEICDTILLVEGEFTGVKDHHLQLLPLHVREHPLVIEPGGENTCEKEEETIVCLVYEDEPCLVDDAHTWLLIEHFPLLWLLLAVKAAVHSSILVYHSLALHFCDELVPGPDSCPPTSHTFTLHSAQYTWQGLTSHTWE